VVSINLCTDQLAMMLAAPGQLVSVSHVAADPRVSPLAEEAARYRLNHGQAEEVHALAPDLVLAGPYTSRYAVGLLRRLGVEVRELPAAERLEDIPGAVAQIGAWLGRDDAAEALIAEFEAGLAA
jgi:iron complex transport system substrate-binding protein